MSNGYIYVLLNRALQKDHYKIGKTTKNPIIRAQELSTATGVPQHFEVIYYELVADCDQAERLVHDKLAPYRISGNKEFFQITLKRVIDAIQGAADTVGRITESELPESRDNAVYQNTSEATASEGETDILSPEMTKHGKRPIKGNPPRESDKRLLYRRFWTRLLDKMREQTERFNGIRPTEYYYVQIPVRLERGIVFYLSLNESSIRVEIFFNSGDDIRNAELYERLKRNRSSIEGKFNVPLDWLSKKTCGIKYFFGRGCYRNEEDWQALIDPALESLLLFEETLLPFLKPATP